MEGLASGKERLSFQLHSGKLVWFLAENFIAKKAEEASWDERNQGQRVKTAKLQTTQKEAL